MLHSIKIKEVQIDKKQKFLFIGYMYQSKIESKNHCIYPYLSYCLGQKKLDLVSKNTRTWFVIILCSIFELQPEIF